MKIKLELDMKDFEGLHNALAKVRSTSKTVTISRDALALLLIDHGKLLAHLRAEG